jgi:hypothetical protein
VARVNLAGYFIYGLRPVKIFRTADGGLDCHVLDWDTGDLVRDISYVFKIHFGDSPDVDEVSEPQFDAVVEWLALRRRSRTEPASPDLADAHARIAERLSAVGMPGHAREAADAAVSIRRRASEQASEPVQDE